MAGDGPAGGRGKWSEPGVPHRGWRCLDIEDLGSGETTPCEMCGTPIRFVHYMDHADYPDLLGCGCVCAGHMEQDLARAGRRDKRMRNAARRRLNWPNRAGWHLSAKGNPTITADGFRVTIFPKAGAWSASISFLGGSPVFARQHYATVRDAQLAAFDKMTLMIEEIS